MLYRNCFYQKRVISCGDTVHPQCIVLDLFSSFIDYLVGFCQSEREHWTLQLFIVSTIWGLSLNLIGWFIEISFQTFQT